jgi:hypothetical protein
VVDIGIYKNRSIFINIEANNRLLREESKVKYTKSRVIKAANEIMFRAIIIIGALLRCSISSLPPQSIYLTRFSTYYQGRNPEVTDLLNRPCNIYYILPY